MSNLHSRRGFLNLGGASAAVLLGASAWTRAWAAETPDLVVTNAKVYTVDDAMPRAEAFAVRDGKFIAVGKSDEIMGLAGEGPQTFDAQWIILVPGVIVC